MARLYIGIDPGNSGALATLDSVGPGVYDAPVLAFPKSNGKTGYALSEDAMVDLLRHVIVGTEPFAAIEWAQAMPKQGVSSVFNYGTGFGMWLGVLAALGVPRVRVRPQTWMKEMFKGHGVHDKKLSVRVAKELFPTADINLAKHHGRAEALLIAEYARRTHS